MIKTKLKVLHLLVTIIKLYFYIIFVPQCMIISVATLILYICYYVVSFSFLISSISYISFESQGLWEPTSLSCKARGKVCVHPTLPRLHCGITLGMLLHENIFNQKYRESPVKYQKRENKSLHHTKK